MHAADMCLNALKGLRTSSLLTNQLSAKNPLRKALRRGFREEWYPTLVYLRRTASHKPAKHARVTNEWTKLGEDLGFEEDIQKTHYEHELRKALQYCTRGTCQYNKKTTPVRVRACKGCAEAVSTMSMFESCLNSILRVLQRYCSAACQRIDWKEGHKSRCKRLNEKPEEPASGSAN